MTDEIRIPVRPPFDFAATARFLRFTENEVVDVWHEGRYRRAFHPVHHTPIDKPKRNAQSKNQTAGDDVQVLEVAFDNTERRKPALVVSLLERESRKGVSSSTFEFALNEAARIARHIFNPEHDLRKFAAQMRDDPLMSRIERAHRGLRLPCWLSLFEALATSILSQQISTAVAITLKRRFVERYGARVTRVGAEFIAFPRAEDLTDATAEDLRAMGISFAKAASILELARSIIDGSINDTELSGMDNETAITRLSTLRGVGRWTAEWALLLYFGRTDIFPTGDLVLRQMVAKYYMAEVAINERTLRGFAKDSWGAWQSYVAIYMFAAMRAGQISLREPNDSNEQSARLDRALTAQRASSTKAPRAKQSINMIESDATLARAPLTKRRRPDDPLSPVSDAATATQISPRPVLIRNNKKR